MTIPGLVFQPRHDSRPERAGALEYVTCPTCGAAPGALCTFETVRGPEPMSYGHDARRDEYAAGRGLLYPEPTSIPPEIWKSCRDGHHEACRPHPPGCPCKPPDPCECPCHTPQTAGNKSSASVDDLLG